MVRCQRRCGSKATCPRCQTDTEARIQITWYIGGKRQRELTACWREQDALDVLQRKEADYWRRQDLGVERAIGGALGQAIEAFERDTAGLSVNYRKQIRTALAALAEGMGREYPVQAIAAPDIRAFRDDGLAVLSPATVRSYLLVLQRFFAYLLREGWIRRDPFGAGAAAVRLPRARGRKDHLRPEEVGPVLDAFWQLSPDVAAIATALVLGGWRKGEIVNLRHADVYLDEGWAYVLDFEGDELTEAWSAKTAGSVRAVPLHALVVRALVALGVSGARCAQAAPLSRCAGPGAACVRGSPLAGDWVLWRQAAPGAHGRGHRAPVHGARSQAHVRRALAGVGPRTQ